MTLAIWFGWICSGCEDGFYDGSRILVGGLVSCYDGYGWFLILDSWSGAGLCMWSPMAVVSIL